MAVQGCFHLTLCVVPACTGDHVKLSGVSWHPQWDGLGLLSAESGVREVQAYDKIPIVS